MKNPFLESEFSDFEDAMQYYAAEKYRIGFIITRKIILTGLL
jgi:predicted nucleic acid-binding protein